MMNGFFLVYGTARWPDVLVCDLMANAESSTLFGLPGEGYQYQEKYGVSFFYLLAIQQAKK